MPNCDYYGNVEDHKHILDFLFSENSCDIFELTSDFEKPLIRFGSTEEILDQFSKCYTNGKKWHTVYLQLYVKGSGPNFKPTRKKLVPEKCNGASYRFAAEGWGLVQLYLSTTIEKKLPNSHTNHNTLKRAEKWFSISQELGAPSAWDFDRINKFSSQLNREIRKRKVAKLGSRVVLPGGLTAWNDGCILSPYIPGKHQIEIL